MRSLFNQVWLMTVTFLGLARRVGTCRCSVVELFIINRSSISRFLNNNDRTHKPNSRECSKAPIIRAHPLILLVEEGAGSDGHARLVHAYVHSFAVSGTRANDYSALCAYI